MRNLTQSRVLRYGLAFAGYCLLIGFSTGLRRNWGISFDVTSLVILMMIASAWYLGRGPGLLVALLFEATLDYYAGFPSNSPRAYVILFNRIVLFGSVVLFASARRNAEDKLRQTGEQLTETLARERTARAEAESASRMKDNFLATVSHELRTPLNAILGWSATLSRHAVDEDTTRQAVQVIERNANAQARLVDDILDFSLIQKGRLRIQPQPVALATVVREAIETVRLSAAAKAITLESSLDIDATVPGDPDRLRQITWNLLSNAVKFTPGGGRILVRLSAAGTGVELKVEDTGAGIDPAFLPHVFDQFRQGDQSMTRAHGGLGLGLAIVRHLVELHGGTISVASDGLGQGAAFTIKLPVARQEAAKSQRQIPSAQTSKLPAAST